MSSLGFTHRPASVRPRRGKLLGATEVECGNSAADRKGKDHNL
ncbi:hypothetical protein PHB09_069 [Pseudomonas phage PHB09]|uniref:Uncharacterized protein n=1 Tax=Pseudomonas phage PHB09 TaxID=2867265 RepID=A0AAE8XCT5_9CAUD|nr:hypothetical protein QGX10_gp069 [Pseudomonas phage PHB09]UAV84565.1 hypothetical protein PHB09_069 [Pseudomonas phage PHB09]